MPEGEVKVAVVEVNMIRHTVTSLSGLVSYLTSFALTRLFIGSEPSDKDVAVADMMEPEQGFSNEEIPGGKLPRDRAGDEASRGCRTKRRTEEPKRVAAKPKRRVEAKD